MMNKTSKVRGLLLSTALFIIARASSDNHLRICDNEYDLMYEFSDCDLDSQTRQGKIVDLI